MCFSATASFATGAALIPAALYCSRAAIRKDQRYFPLALIPMGFGVQQLCEGLVWHGLEAGDPDLVQKASVVFLFFAVAFWPIWVPLSMLMPEDRYWARELMGLFVASGPVWLWLYFPLAVDPNQWLTTRIAGHSIQYEFGDLPGYHIVPRTVWRSVYVLMVVTPLVIGRLGKGGDRVVSIVAGGLVLLLAIVSVVAYWTVFTSVWCFFAAVVSLLLVHVFHQLPMQYAPGGNRPPAAAGLPIEA